MLSQFRRRVYGFSAALLVSACSSGGDGGVDPVAANVSTMTLSVSTLNVPKGTTQSTLVSIARRAGYTGSITLTAEGAPGGVNVTFAPASLDGSATQSTLSVNVTAAATPGTYTVTIRANGGDSQNKTATLTVVVPTPSIGVTLAATTASAPQGQATTVGITVSRAGGFTGDITLAAENLPTGVTASFAPAVVGGTQTASTLTLTTTNEAVVATTPITIRATGAGVTAQTSVVQFSVTASTTPSISLSATPTVVPIVAGQSGTSTITIGRSGGFAGNVNFAVEGNPAGVTATFAPNGTAGNTTVMTINTTGAAQRGPANLTVRATGTGIADATTIITAQINDAPGISFTLTSAAQSIAAGANGNNTLTLARLGDFTGAVTLAVTGLPAGVTTNLPASIAAGTTSVPFTITVPANVTPNVYPIVITGTGAGGLTTQTTLTLTVTAAPGVSLVATPTALSIAQNANGQTTVAVNRLGGFAGNVNLTITGLPAGITPTFAPASVPNGTPTSQLTLAVGGAVAPQTYNAVIRANATGLTEVTIPLPVTVTATGGANTVSWRFCTADDVPIWFGYQDGNGAWTRVNVGANNTFTFDINAANGGVTMVEGSGSFFNVETYYQTRAELIALGAAECVADPATRNYTGTIAGIPLGRTATVSAGNTVTIVNGNGPYSLNGAPGRKFDVLAFRMLGNTPERGILRRDLDPPANSALALLDFDGADAFAPAVAQITLQNANGEAMAVQTAFISPNGRVASTPTASVIAGNTNATVFGIPSSRTAAGDFHQLTALTFTTGRMVVRYHRDLTNMAITFGPVLNLPTVTTIATAPYARLRTSGTWMNEYSTGGGVLYEHDFGTWTVTQSRNYNAAAAYQMDIPDLSGAGGFLSTWGPRTGEEVTWTATFTDATTAAMTEGGGFKLAARTGTITP